MCRPQSPNKPTQASKAADCCRALPQRQRPSAAARAHSCRRRRVTASTRPHRHTPNTRTHMAYLTHPSHPISLSLPLSLSLPPLHTCVRCSRRAARSCPLRGPLRFWLRSGPRPCRPSSCTRSQQPPPLADSISGRPLADSGAQRGRWRRPPTHCRRLYTHTQPAVAGRPRHRLPRRLAPSQAVLPTLGGLPHPRQCYPPRRSVCPTPGGLPHPRRSAPRRSARRP